MDVAWLDAHLATEGVDHTRAVGPDKPRLALTIEGVDYLDLCIRVMCGDGQCVNAHLELVRLGYALSNADNEPNLIFNGFNNCIGCCRWWHIEDSSVRLHLLYSL